MLKTILAGFAMTAAIGVASPSDAQAGDWRVEFRFGDCGSRARISYGRSYTSYRECAPRYTCRAPRYYDRCAPRYRAYDCRPVYRVYRPNYYYCR